MTGTVEVRLFGSPEITCDGLPAAVDTRKAIALLSILAVEGRPLRRDRLAAMLWAEASQDRARANLRRTLSALRGAIGEEGIMSDREQIQLALPPERVDVLQFETLAVADPAAALALFRGDLLEGFSTSDAPEFEDWQRRQAERYRGSVDRLLDDLAGASEPAEAAALAQRRLALDPLNEPAAQQAMAALAGAGDRAGAIAIYRTLLARLHDELGVEPLEATTAAYEEIRRGHPTPAATPVQMPVAVVGHGTFGRDVELARLDELAAAHRMVAVTGEAGVGRSHLVRAWAAQRGALVLRCHAGEQPVAYGLFAPWMPDHTEIGQLDLFRLLAAQLELDRGGVLVVDDLHLGDPASLAFLVFVLHRPDTFAGTVVATVDDNDRSELRALLAEGLGEGWAAELRVGRLEADAVADLVRSNGVADPAAIERIVTTSEGLPLVAAELARDPAVEVPRSVLLAVEARLASLTSAARQVVEVLGLLDRPVGAEIVQRVAGRTLDEVLVGLDELTGAGLIRQDDLAEVNHRLIGRIAVEGMTPARREAVHRRAARVLPPSEAATHALDAGDRSLAADLHRRAAGDAMAVNAVSSALEHLRASVECAGPGDGTLHRRIARLEVLDGQYAAAAVTLELAAARLTGAELARTELELADLARRLGDLDLASSHVESAAAEAPDDDPLLAVEVAIAQACVAVELGREHPVDPGSLLAGVDHVGLEARAHAAIALGALRRGDPAAGRDAAERALHLARLAPDLHVIAQAANLAGLAATRLGDHPAAEQLLADASGILIRQGDRHRLAAVLTNLADTLHTMGRDDEARMQQIEAARLFAEVGGDPRAGRAGIWSLTAW